MRNLRNNGVLAYGIVTTFSHEGAEKIDIEKSQQNNVKWLKNTFNLTPKNGKSVRGVMYHGDEYEKMCIRDRLNAFMPRIYKTFLPFIVSGIFTFTAFPL